jgi:hypothetical protein
VVRRNTVVGANVAEKRVVLTIFAAHAALDPIG